jgi:hypothetical protein
MAEDCGVRPPLVWRGVVRLASWAVPPDARAVWRARWNSGLLSWRVLVERGEIRGGAAAQIHVAGEACVDALRLRFRQMEPRHWIRGPACLLFGAALALVVTAIFTRGFAVTRSLIETARSLQASPPAQQNLLVAHLVPIGFALATGMVLVAAGRLWLHAYGWRYWLFLVLKTMAVMAIVPLVWIEGGAAVRAWLPGGPLRVLAGGVGLALVFIFVFGSALEWSFVDQRRRCPVCLRRLAIPVTVGSWASVFEPAATELVCDQGHGSFCVSESETAAPEHWTTLDASWRGLFETPRPRR